MIHSKPKQMIKVCHINVTSIKKHQQEIYARYHNFDILSINETNLKPQHQFHIRGFNIFRNDRTEKSGGGVLLAIKENLRCREVINKTVETNETVAVQLETTGGPLLVATIYVPPKAKINKEVFDEIYQQNNSCLIMGDLNASLQSKGSRKTNAKGRQLEELLKEGTLQCIETSNTTYERHEYEEKLDWIIASQPTIFYITKIDTEPPLGQTSGHKPTIFDLVTTPELKPKTPRLNLNFKSANWQSYRAKLNNLLKNRDSQKQPQTKEEIESYSEFVTSSIVEAAKDAIAPPNPTPKPIEPNAITKKLILQKHHAYRQWKKNNSDAEKQQYYRCKTLVANALRNERITRFNQLMKTLSTKKMNSGQVWATVKRYHNKRTKQTCPGTIKHNTQTAQAEQDKANLFAAYFETEVFKETPNNLPFHHQISEQTTRIKNRLEQSAKMPPPITGREIKTTIKQLQNSSPGPDHVHNRCLKNHTKPLIRHLTTLFNAVISSGHVPIAWKKANIILILKPKKDKQEVASYRPISLLSCLGKLLEKIIKQRLTKEIESRKILPTHQTGFRPGKSTINNITRLERFVQAEKTKRRHSAVLFFDIRAAFDSVWFEGLIYKFADLRMPEYLTRYLVSFLESRTATIEFENTLSRSFPLRRGTPQGSPLSPLLYILYTSDSMNGMPDHTEHGLFADDTALWTTSNTIKNLKSRLQQSTDEFQRWCETW